MDSSCSNNLKNQKGIIPIIAILLVIIVVGIILGTTLLTRNRSNISQQPTQASDSAKKRLSVGDFVIDNGSLPRITTVQLGSTIATLSSASAPIGTNIRNLPIEFNGTKKQFPFICPNTVCKPQDLTVPVTNFSAMYDATTDSVVVSLKVNGSQINSQAPCNSTGADAAICAQGRSIPTPAITPPVMPTDNQTKGTSPGAASYKLNTFYSASTGNTKNPFTFVGRVGGGYQFLVDGRQITLDTGEYTTVNGTFVRINPGGMVEYFNSVNLSWTPIADGTSIEGGLGNGGRILSVVNPGAFYGPGGVNNSSRDQFTFTGCIADGCHFNVDGHDIIIKPGDYTTINNTFIRYAPSLPGASPGEQLQFWDGKAWRDLALNNTPIPGGVGGSVSGNWTYAYQPPSGLTVGQYYCDGAANCGYYTGNMSNGNQTLCNAGGQCFGTIVTNTNPQTPPVGNGNNGSAGPGQYSGPTGVACGAGGCVGNCGVACTGSMVPSQPGLGNYTQNANGTFSPCAGSAGCTWSLQGSKKGGSTGSGSFSNGLNSPSGCQTVQCQIDHGEIIIDRSLD